MITLRVVFQGGGAKLATLMAAANAIRELEKERRVKIQSIAGTSAGSIVACMLAAERPYGEFREAVKRAGAEVIDSLRLPGRLRAMWKVYRGSPLLSESTLRRFLNEVFGQSSPPIRRLRDLKCQTTVVATDLRHREKILFRSDLHGDMTIEDAIASSCALPFVFRSHRDTTYVVDGGVCSNLPAEALFADAPDSSDDSLILAFSFEAERQDEPRGVLQYAGALLSTAMDASVAAAADRIEAAGGVLCELPKEYGTLEFARALDEGLSTAKFEATTKAVRRKIEEALGIHWQNSRIKEPADQVKLKMLKMHRALLKEYPYDVHHSSTYIVANSLRQPNDPGFHDPDRVVQRVEYTALRRQLWTLRVGISTAFIAPVAGEADWRVQDLDGNTIEASHVIVPETVRTAEGKDLTIYWALFFLGRPIELKEGRRVRVTLRSTQRDILPALKNGFPDFMRTKIATDNQATEDHVVAIPEDYGRIGLGDLAGEVDRIPTHFRPSAIDDMRRNWKKGRPMTQQELAAYADLPPDGCRLYGWRTENPSKGQYCGVLIAR